MLTGQQVLDEVTLALRSPMRAEIGGVRFVNRVGREFVRLSPWRYLQGRTASLSVVSGTAAVELPNDVDKIDEIAHTPQQAPWRPIKWTSDWGEFQRWVSWGSAYMSGWRYLGAVNQQPNATGRTVPYLHLSPTPTQDDTLELRYRAGWTLIDTLDDVLVVPDELEEGVLATARAMARALEVQPEGVAGDPMGAAMAALRASPQIRSLRQRDGSLSPRRSPTPGPIGLALDRAQSRNGWGPRFDRDLNLP